MVTVSEDSQFSVLFELIVTQISLFDENTESISIEILQMKGTGTKFFLSKERFHSPRASRVGVLS